MLLFRGKIPVLIHPLFWVLAALIGWMNASTLLGTLIWVGIIFFSVLFHEYGHALMAVLFKQKAHIQLVALGGVTSYEGPKLRFWQQFLIVLNGPLFGFFLFLLATLALQLNLSQFPLLKATLRVSQIANLFWTIVNLLPVMPLDGGQLLRIVLEAFFGIRGFRASLLIGSMIACLIAFAFFVLQAFLIGALFFLFAFQSFESWRKSRYLTPKDREEEHVKKMLEAEKALSQGDKPRARQLFQEVYEQTAGGVLSVSAAQYLALLLHEQGQEQQAYEMLLPLEEKLDSEAKGLLHRLAFEAQNYDLVAKLSAECFQTQPSQETALRNAQAFASLGQATPAGGWLQTAQQEGALDLAQVLRRKEFEKVKDSLEFQKFFS